MPGVNKGIGCDKTQAGQAGLKSKAKKIFGIAKSPLFSMLSPVHFEINGNREAIVEGCRCILQYNENIVKISVKKMSVSFSGRHLVIKCLTHDSLIVQGFITSIEFSV